MAYAKSDWATKINEREVAKQMPLLSEFSGYKDWGDDAKRRAEMLYNRPISLSIIYFIVNLIDSVDLTDKVESGHLKHKLALKVNSNEGP